MEHQSLLVSALKSKSQVLTFGKVSRVSSEEGKSWTICSASSRHAESGAEGFWSSGAGLSAGEPSLSARQTYQA